MKVGMALTAALALACMEGLAQRTPPTPAEMAQREVARYTSLLSLTQAQQDQATAIFTAEATDEQGTRQSERTARQALETAVTNNDTASIQQQAASLGQLQGQSLASRSLAEAKFYATLTADQKTKLADLKQQHLLGGSGGPGGRGPGGPGGPGL